MTFQPRELKLTKSESAGVKRLQEMLTFCRPHGSEVERTWVETFIDPFFQHENVSEHYIDDVGNRWLLVGANPTTMFTAHTDTVHSTPGTQRVTMTGHVIHLPADSTSTCLGADDAAGCWMLTRMIQAGVPGLYAFFRGEERGGIGSKWAAQNATAEIKNIQRCISFDRKADYSVITHQGFGGRCCSDEFAEALAGQLCNDTLMYAPDDTGVFTDSANFVDIIPECTNLSVGYYDEHTKKEALDVYHLVHLARAVVGVKWDALPVERDPSAYDEEHWSDSTLFGGGYSYRPGRMSELKARDIDDMVFHELVEMVAEADPLEVAELIADLAYDVTHPRYQ